MPSAHGIPLASSFIEKMHEGVINSRDLIVLFTHDYLQSRYTRKEFTSFEEERQSQEERHIIVLRCERKKDECWAFERNLWGGNSHRPL
jgi:hypothetical protein